MRKYMLLKYVVKIVSIWTISHITFENKINPNENVYAVSEYKFKFSEHCKTDTKNLERIYPKLSLFSVTPIFERHYVLGWNSI